MTQHPLDPLDHEVPPVVVVSTAELGSEHELVDARDRRSEHPRVIAVGRALVHQDLVEDDWVDLDISDYTLVGGKEKNSAPCDTDLSLNQISKD